MKRKLITLALAALTMGLLASCDIYPRGPYTVPVTGVALDKTTLEITVGDADVQLAATVAPENATDKTVIWTSDKSEFATVDTEGNVHAVAPGTATITVTTTDGGKTAACVVTVKAGLPDGALPGVFTVADDGNGNVRKVHFSQGNLWYGKVGSATTATWNFEANQYDFTPTSNTSWDSGHISHFFWSKSADVICAASYTESGTTKNDVFFTNTDAETAKSDFTVNGVTGKYRTLSTGEWRYLINDEGKENIRKGKYKYGVTVCGKAKCLVLAPDECLSGYSFDNTKTSYTEDEWASAEAAGLVCLPVAGDRTGSNVYSVGGNGIYWSSSAHGNVSNAYCVYFDGSGVYPFSSDSRSHGVSVRLIADVPAAN